MGEGIRGHPILSMSIKECPTLQGRDGPKPFVPAAAKTCAPPASMQPLLLMGVANVPITRTILKG